MSDHFKRLRSELKQVDPKSDHLKLFVEETIDLLRDLVGPSNIAPDLFGNDAELKKIAQKTFKEDVVPAAEKLIQSVDKIDDEYMRNHGLAGTPALFKYKVLLKNTRYWYLRKGRLTIGKGFRKILESIDVILDSLISAAPAGIGGLIKEFKDALMALAPSYAIE